MIEHKQERQRWRHTPLEKFLAEIGDPVLSEQLTLLNRRLYAASTNASWNPETCADALVRARKKITHLRRHQAANQHALNPLNPSHQEA